MVTAVTHVGPRREPPADEMAMTDDRNQPLRPRLHQLERELEERVAQVCETPPVEKLDTGEMIRYEENLAMAADAAKEAVSLRRRLSEDSKAARPAMEPRRNPTRPTDGGGLETNP